MRPSSSRQGTFIGQYEMHAMHRGWPDISFWFSNGSLRIEFAFSHPIRLSFETANIIEGLSAF